MIVQHQDIRSLLGAFVLGATSPLEHQGIEQHLASCEPCAREVGSLREAVDELAWFPAPDTDELVGRIAQVLPYRPRRIPTRAAAVVAAVSVAAAGFFGAALVRERSQTSDLAHVLSEADRHVTLAARSGFEGSGVLYVGAKGSALILDNVPGAGRERSYQAWAIAGARPTSLAVFGETGRIVRLLTWSVRADRFTVTIEPERGSAAPTTEPVLDSS